MKSKPDHYAEFEEWFKNLMFKRTKSCNERTVFRNAKGALRTAYVNMCIVQDAPDATRIEFSGDFMDCKYNSEDKP